MELVIDLDKIEDPAKLKWLFDTLKLAEIDFETVERPQTIEEYNLDLERGNAEVDRGEYTTLEDVRKEMKNW